MRTRTCTFLTRTVSAILWLAIFNRYSIYVIRQLCAECCLCRDGGRCAYAITGKVALFLYGTENWRKRLPMGRGGCIPSWSNLIPSESARSIRKRPQHFHIASYWGCHRHCLYVTGLAKGTIWGYAKMLVRG